MFRRRTLFVLGAGASFEAGLPTGPEIARTIAKKMDVRFEMGRKPVGEGDYDLFAQLTNSLRQNANEFQQAAWVIRDGIGYSQSIDDFLDQHRSNEFVVRYGKAALAKTILEAERGSKLFFNPHEGKTKFDAVSLANTWFVKFMYVLGRGVPQEDAHEIFRNVGFVVFNYDRCLEHFLTHALGKTYNITEAEAAAIVATAHIIHPYGLVPGANFGNANVNFPQAAASIKTYTEQASDDGVTDRIEEEMHLARCIVFLGFAYHRQNMDLLRPAKVDISALPIYGTAFGMSESDVDIVSNDLTSFFGDYVDPVERKRLIKLENKLKCADLFDNYARSLTAAG